MLLNFVFVIDKDDLGKRTKEFEYVKLMAQFYKKWVMDTFSIDVEVQCDEMVAHRQGLLSRLDTSVLLEDHRSRGKNTFHFYLCHFRPLWTDCPCEGYYAENFAMILWQKPKDEDDILFLAQKNCTVVSHELSHEFLRQNKVKKQSDIVHDAWSKHVFGGLPFEQYGKNFEKTSTNPYFLTIDTSGFR
ncbi:hypothetical protein [Candidatus Nitrosotenuis uzonensis]|uniref:Uncharacterized protein n=1 Tax=Candidatus Nitrosotenuis uzonensis TaxID=1407055 RepID=A0A812F4P4_9ARCH|nr:hypothetical protein [Candidatus Nitrosotenuis uzonensis]MCA2003592.1 hypothetical protein [Candidatus Nitrosotenuis sp.]CAE6495063.1 conserved hypothetical protein [Candidatus Nitrosotenuis uzonensis]